MDWQKTRYVVLRDGQSWDGITTNLLEQSKDGALVLARVPGAAPGQQIDLPGPYEAQPSGIAVDSSGAVYISDTDGGRVIRIDGKCKTRMVLRRDACAHANGQSSAPRGLLLGPPGGLYVADSSKGQVAVFRLPTLELHAIWQGTLQMPACLAADGQGRVYLLDRGLKQVRRYSAWGVADDAYNANLAAQPDLTSPAFLAVDNDDVLYVSDDAANAVLRFDPDGNPIGPLPPADVQPPAQPRALATFGNHLYIADAAGGSIYVFDLGNQVYLETVVGYRGPVTAMTAGEDGTLYVKPDMGETFYALSADAGCVSTGRLTAGPFDAGELSDWSRVRAQIESPAQTSARLQLFVTDDAAAVPTEPDWVGALALDTLVPALPLDADGQPRLNRYSWLRVDLASADRRSSPRLLQISAETAGESYLKFLPAIYQLEDGGQKFLRRWLALFKAELGDATLSLEDMPRRFEPSLAPEEFLKWLASWFAFNLPGGRPVDEQRSLLQQAYQLYDSRATHFGVREFSQIYAGVRPHIIEGFRGRHIWQLGTTSALGCDTGLAPISPNGMIVPDKPLAGSADHKTPCDGPQQLVVGNIVVGESGPLDEGDAGESLFMDTAYRFTVLTPAALLPEFTDREALRRIIDSEKPAHTDYHLCFIEARMRVGFQARLGIDTIVAGQPDPMALSGTVLGLDSYLGVEEGGDQISRVGKDARVGFDTVLG